jgi:hypothetical protein
MATKVKTKVEEKAAKAAAKADAKTKEAEYMKETKVHRFLINAALDGNVKRAALLVAQGADVNFVHKDKRTALSVALAKGHAEMTRFLLDHGADPICYDYYASGIPFDGTIGPIHLFERVINSCKFEKNAHRSIFAHTPLHNGEYYKYIDTAMCLVDKNVISMDYAIRRFIEEFSETDTNLDIFKAFIERGYSPKTEDEKGRTVLYLARQNGRYRLAKFIEDLEQSSAPKGLEQIQVERARNDSANTK